MKKYLPLIICVLILCPTVPARRNQPLANQNKPGLYARSIEQVLRLREDEVDLATAAIWLTAEDILLSWITWRWRFAKGSNAKTTG
jgi:hypothetical protein